jgi:hypothetical protein
MSPAQETQSMWEIRLLRGRLAHKGEGLTGIRKGLFCNIKKGGDMARETTDRFYVVP